MDGTVQEVKEKARKHLLVEFYLKIQKRYGLDLMGKRYKVCEGMEMCLNSGSSDAVRKEN